MENPLKFMNQLVIIGILISLISCVNENPVNVKETDSDQVSANKALADSVLKEQLLSLSVKDQTLRFLLPDVAERFGGGSFEEKYFWSLINQQDSINEHEIGQIIETHGWLGKSRVGSDANQALWLVIQHAPLEVQERYLPLLRASVAKNESEGWHLAFLEDRILMRNGKNQIYGSQAMYNKETQQFEIYPIEDVEKVNERRAEIGLNTIEEHAASNGYVFNEKK